MKKPNVKCAVCGTKLPPPKKEGRRREYCDDIYCKQLGSLAKKKGKKIVSA